MALAARSLAFCFERSDGRSRWQTVERHVHKQRVATGRVGASRRAESFPLRPPGFVDVDVSVHQPRQNGGLAKILRGTLRRQLMWGNNIEDSAVFDEHCRGFDTVRRDYTS